jgi:plastocyanin
MVPLAKIASLLVLAAAGEKSKTPFYVAGGVLAGWAVLVSAMGLRQAEFPRTRGAARTVMGISVALVATAIAMAVVTASRHERASEASAATPPAPGAPASAPAAPGGRPTPGAGSSNVSLAADPTGQLRYDRSSLRARPGKVTIAFVNQSPVPHNVTVESAGRTVGATQTVTGSATKVALRLAPGTYTYFCSVDAHRQAGMQGTLVVG